MTEGFFSFSVLTHKGWAIPRIVFQIFPIGDLHIESMSQSNAFANYLNLRTERLIVLLGDVIHFANSFWNPSAGQMSRAEMLRNLDKDISIWEDFIARLKVHTIYYMGSHEQFVLRVKRKFLPSRKLNLANKFVYVPNDLQLIQLGSPSEPLFLTGLHIPDNIHPIKSEEFLQRKKKIEKWIEKKIRILKIPEPKKTILCTHDPCDSFYRNMGYHGLTQMLERWVFKTHYHAHIHSNIRQTLIGETPSINRSFVALSKLDPQALEPSTSEIQPLYGRDI